MVGLHAGDVEELSRRYASEMKGIPVLGEFSQRVDKGFAHARPSREGWSTTGRMSACSLLVCLFHGEYTHMGSGIPDYYRLG